MTRVAVIEDDAPTSRQLAGWICAARPGIEVHQWYDREIPTMHLGAAKGVMAPFSAELAELPFLTGSRRNGLSGWRLTVGVNGFGRRLRIHSMGPV